MPRKLPPILTGAIALAGCAVFAPPAAAQNSGAMETVDLEHLGDALFESAAPVDADAGVVESAADRITGPGDADQPRSGRWRAAPHLDLKATFDDNIFIQPDHEVADLIFTAAPGIAFGFWDYEIRLERFLDREQRASRIDRDPGNFLLADYTAILLGFVKTPAENAFDQDARLDAQCHTAKLTIGLGSHFESKSETSVDIGTRVRRTALATELSASYQATEKTSLSVSFFHVLDRYNSVEGAQSFSELTEWRNETYVDYQITPRLRASVGGAFGLVQVDSAGDQVFERILARALYAMSEKVTVEARGGVEFRQFDGPPGDEVDPIFDFEARYSPAEATDIEVRAYRHVETSALRPEQDYTATGVSARFRRTLLPGFQVALTGGYQSADYADVPGAPARKDHYFFVRPSFRYNFAAWGSCEFTYEFRQNDSSRQSASFTNSQVTVQTSLTY